VTTIGEMIKLAAEIGVGKMAGARSLKKRAARMKYEQESKLPKNNPGKTEKETDTKKNGANVVQSTAR